VLHADDSASANVRGAVHGAHRAATGCERPGLSLGRFDLSQFARQAREVMLERRAAFLDAALSRLAAAG
jgi:hypothetical protein